MFVPSLALLVGFLLDLAVLVFRSNAGMIAAVCAVKAFLWARVFAFVVVPYISRAYGSKLVAAPLSISSLVVKQTCEPMPLVAAIENRGASQVCFYLLAHLSPSWSSLFLVYRSSSNTFSHILPSLFSDASLHPSTARPRPLAFVYRQGPGD
jgi:hypothetical protein